MVAEAPSKKQAEGQEVVGENGSEQQEGNDAGEGSSVGNGNPADSEDADAVSTPQKGKRKENREDTNVSPSKKTAGTHRTLPFGDWKPEYTFVGDLKVLGAMWFGKIAGDTHQDRLECFYRSQAHLYDGYRSRMLHARVPLMSRLPVEADRKGEVVWIDLGGGTGSNVEYVAPAIAEGWFKRIVVLDLTPSLCEVARERVEKRWPGGVVEVLCADACDEQAQGLPAAGSCDLVTFSYALVMIPDWKKAVDNALRLLRPGGHIGVCDFTVLPEEGQTGMMQSFWKKTFASDHVILTTEHRDYLKSVTDQVYEETGFGSLPYVPGFLKAGWYAFIGKKRASTAAPRRRLR